MKITIESFVKALNECESRIVKINKPFESWVKECNNTDGPVNRTNDGMAIQMFHGEPHKIYPLHKLATILSCSESTIRKFCKKMDIWVEMGGINETTTGLKQHLPDYNQTKW